MMINMNKKYWILLGIFLFSIFPAVKGVELCYLISDMTPITNLWFIQNTSDELFDLYDNGTFQYEIGSDCGAGNCVYGVNDDGSLDCRACSSAAGVNYWMASDGWMEPNTSAGGKVNINVTRINATTVFENSISLTDKYIEFGDTGYNCSVANSCSNAQYGTEQVNTSAQMIDAVNNSLPYNITAWFCEYVDNTTERAAFTTTYNDTYHANIDTVNTSTEMRAAINGSGSYNITSWFCLYVDNSTERTAFINTYNDTYHSYIESNVSSIADVAYYLENSTQETEFTNTTNTTYDAHVTSNASSSADVSYYLENATQETEFTSTFNTTYDVNIDTVNTSAEMIIAVNNSLSYNITSWFCEYVDNTTERAAFTNRTNTTYDAYITSNVSSISDVTYYLENATQETEFTTTYNSTYDTNIDTVNTTAEMIAAINGSGTYNITSWFCEYVDNTTERVAFTNRTNTTYDAYITSNASSTADVSYYLENTTQEAEFKTTYNATYDANIDTVNTTQEMIDAVNNSLSYNITSWFCEYVDNSTERAAFITTYNSTYHGYVESNVSSIADVSYYLENTTQETEFTTTYNTTYDADVGKTYNSTYEDYLQWANATAGMHLGDNIRFYFGDDNDVFIMFNSTAGAGQLG